MGSPFPIIPQTDRPALSIRGPKRAACRGSDAGRCGMGMGFLTSPSIEWRDWGRGGQTCGESIRRVVSGSMQRKLYSAGGVPKTRFTPEMRATGIRMIGPGLESMALGARGASMGLQTTPCKAYKTAHEITNRDRSPACRLSPRQAVAGGVPRRFRLKRRLPRDGPGGS